MTKRIVLLTLIFLGCLQIAAFADIKVEQRTGALKITKPDGSVVMVAPADALPVIPDGSTVEAVDGVVLLSTTDASTAKVISKGQSFQLTPGTTINQTFDTEGLALFEVVAGQASLLTADGWTAALGPCAQIRTSGVVTVASGMNVIKGEVFLTDAAGKTVTMAGAPCAEAYQPPAIPDTPALDTGVRNEENSRDISSVNG